MPHSLRGLSGVFSVSSIQISLSRYILFMHNDATERKICYDEENLILQM